MLIFIIIFSLSWSTDYERSEPVIRVIEESTMEGNPELIISREPCAPVTDIVVHNSTICDESEGWYKFRYDYGVIQVHDNSEEVQIQLQDTPTSSHVRFIGRPYLPVMNYSEIRYSIPTRVLKGSANFSLRVGFQRWPDGFFFEAAENWIFLEQGNDTDLRLITTMNEVYNDTDDWIFYATMVLIITSTEASTISVGKVVISVESEEGLYPVSVDVQAPDGESLFENPNTNLMSVYYDKDTYEMYTGYYPALDLTRTGNRTEGSVFIPRKCNATLYLGEGTYEGFAGWIFGRNRQWALGFSCNFSIESGEAIHIIARVPAFRLTIDITPVFAYSRVYVSGGFLYELDYPFQKPYFLYIPSSFSEFAVTIRPLMYNSHRPDKLHYRFSEDLQPRARTEILTNGTTCIRVEVAFSEFSLFPGIFDIGQFVSILSIIALMFIFLFDARKQIPLKIRSYPTTKYSLLPITLYFISLFTPGVTYSFVTAAVSPTTIFGVIIIPFGRAFWWSSQSWLTPAPSNYLVLDVLWIGVLFWVPFLYLCSLIIKPNELITPESLLDPEYIPTSIIVFCPFIIGCYYLFLCLTGVCSPGIGLITMLAITPAWLFMYWFSGREKKEQDILSNLSVYHQ